MEIEYICIIYTHHFVFFPNFTSTVQTSVLPYSTSVMEASFVARNTLENKSIGSTICVCVFFPFILDIKFVGRTSRGHTGGRSHRISHPPSF